MDNLDSLRSQVIPLLRPYSRRIAVFGSFARGEQTPSSDVDIVVELLPPDRRPPLGLKWFGLEEELARVVGRPVDLVTFRSLSPFLRPRVEKEMVLLYGEG